MTVTLRHDEPEPNSTWDADPAPRLPAPEPATRRGLLRRRTPIERAADLERQRDAARKVMAVQDDPALVKALSAGELAAERQAAEQVRAAQREQRRRSQLAEVARQARDRRAADREADIEAGDRVWHRRALSARRRAMSPDARLAQVARARRWITIGLAAVIATGVLVSSVTVQHNMAAGQNWQQPTWWMWFFVDPMLSVPLVMLLLVRGIGVQWGRTLDSRLVTITEFALLGVMSALNVGPYLVHARQSGVAGVLGHLIAPGMVALGVLLAPAVTGFLASIIANAVVDAENPGRMDGDTAKVIEAIGRVRALMADGTLTPDTSSSTTPWLPSTSQIGKRLAIGKPTAVSVHDAMERLYPRGEYLTS